MGLVAHLGAYLVAVAAGCAPGTVAIYRYHCSRFVLWLGRRRVSADRCRAYLAGLAGDGLGASTRHGAFRALRAWFRWCVREGRLAADPMAAVRAPRLPEVSRVGLALDQVRVLLAAARSLRDRAAVLFLLDTGLRLQEAAGLVWADVDLPGKWVTVRAGKGGRVRWVPVSPEVAVVLGELRGQAPSAVRVFGMTRAALYQMVRRLGRRVGLHVSPHQLRHTAATWYGGDVEDLRLLLGHRRVSTTAEIYRHREARHLGQVHASRSVVRLLGVEVMPTVGAVLPFGVVPGAARGTNDSGDLDDS